MNLKVKPNTFNCKEDLRTNNYSNCKSKKKAHYSAQLPTSLPLNAKARKKNLLMNQAEVEHHVRSI
jgi:hypothetical protein